ncbi:MAG TPA: alpha/beta fold hydrolase [Gaiellaceae bacterium]|nr:alpha/beta fold hydrolase [Gaiellaceae bacterium]
MVDFRLFGGLEVAVGGRRLRFGGAKERGLLAYLLLNVNRVVSRPAVIDALWGDDAPPTAEHGVEVFVSRLRSSLEPADPGAVLVTRPGGYELVADPERVDVQRFERLVERGRRELEAGRAAAAAATLRTALDLYEGDPLADVAQLPFAAAEARRLEEVRLAAVEAHLDAELALERHAEIVPELEALVAGYPLRERFREQLMIALYRSGRQAEALETYHDARELLVRELGIEPGRALARTERAILQQDPRLNGRAEATETRYADSEGVAIAYQVTGSGPFDVVYVPPFVTNVELMWDVPTWAAFVRRLSTRCRLIRFDKRGTGMSDRVDLGDLQTRVADIRAVMDAVASPRAALIGASEGGPTSIAFAAAYPDRVWALVLSGATACSGEWNAEELEREAEDELRMWTEPGHAEQVAAALGAPEPAQLATMWRQSATPGAILELEALADEVDVRELLASIPVPTLVLNREGDDPVLVEGSRYLAEHIPGARRCELPGDAHVMFAGDWPRVADEIERFLADAWERYAAESGGALPR